MDGNISLEAIKNETVDLVSDSKSHVSITTLLGCFDLAALLLLMFWALQIANLEALVVYERLKIVFSESTLNLFYASNVYIKCITGNKRFN